MHTQNHLESELDFTTQEKDGKSIKKESWGKLLDIPDWMKKMDKNTEGRWRIWMWKETETCIYTHKIR